MKFCFYSPYLPYEDYASSRIRCFSLYKGFQKLGYESYLGFNQKCDYYIINKSITQDVLSLLRIEKEKGAKILYDVCDYPLNTALVYLSDYISCPTLIMAQSINVLYPDETIHVIPDSLDYQIENPIINDKLPNSIGWFGNFNTIDSSFDYLERFKGEKVLITDKYRLETKYGLNRLANYNVINWNHYSFLNDVKNIGINIFSVTEENRYKSDNKAILSLALGIPVMVSKFSSGYNFLERCHNGLGKESLITSKKLSPEIQKAQIQYCQPIIFKERTYIEISKYVYKILLS